MKFFSLNWFSSLKGKMFILAVLPVISSIAIFGVNFSGINTLVKDLNLSTEEIAPGFEQITNLTLELGSVRGGLLYGQLEKVPSERKSYLDKTLVRLNNLTKNIEDFEAHHDLNEEETKRYAPIKAQHSDFVSTTKNIVALLNQNTPEKDQEAFKMTREQFQPYVNSFFEFIDVLSDGHMEEANALTKKAHEETSWIKNLSILITLFSSIIVLVSMFIIGNKFTRTSGHITESLNSSSTQVATAVHQLSSAGQTLSQTATSTAASLQQTVASLEELTSMVAMNTDNARQAATLSATSRNAAEEGERQIKDLITSMNEISTSSKKIEEIINVIDDIAFQTNLLALNAAVEAARAGEQGKGFAVVAEAVRNLAQRSADSAKNISTLIKESVAQISKGTKVADESGTVLNNIVTSVKKVSDLNNEIAAASEEQSNGINQISKAMNQLDRSGQSNAASAEEISATVTEISSQIENVKSLSDNLNVLINGKGGPHPVAHTSKEAKKAEANPESKSDAKTKKATPKVSFASTPAPSAAPAPAKPKKSGSAAAAVIPFDEDEGDGRGNIGSVSGF